MHTRRLTALVLGLWLGASLLMDWIGIVSFSTVEESYSSASHRATDMVRAIGSGPVHQLLRYQTAELNRHYAYDWGFGQCLLGVILLLMVLFATNGNKKALGLSGGMLLLALGMQFGVMPAMLEQDRALDFASSADIARERAAFNGSHNTYIGLETLKLLAGAGLAAVLFYRGSEESSRRKRRRASEVDIIEYPQQSRVNR
jgi:hypothetical protein